MGRCVLRIYPALEKYSCVDQDIKLEGEPLFLTGLYLNILKQNGFEFDFAKWFSTDLHEFTRLAIESLSPPGRDIKGYVKGLVNINVEELLKRVSSDFLDEQVSVLRKSYRLFNEQVSGEKTTGQAIGLKEYFIKNAESIQSVDDIFNFAIQSLLLEALAIIQVVNIWFNPKYLDKKRDFFKENKVKSSLKEIQNAEVDMRSQTLASLFFHVRCRSLRFMPFWDVKTGKLCVQYDSDDVISLCWGEIWQALQQNILAGICPYCGKIYLYPANSHYKASCLSKECKNKSIIARQGSEEAYRKYERDRKRKRKKTEPSI